MTRKKIAKTFFCLLTHAVITPLIAQLVFVAVTVMVAMVTLYGNVRWNNRFGWETIDSFSTLCG